MYNNLHSSIIGIFIKRTTRTVYKIEIINKKIKQIRATNAALCYAFAYILPAIAATPEH